MRLKLQNVHNVWQSDSLYVVCIEYRASYLLTCGGKHSKSLHIPCFTSGQWAAIELEVSRMKSTPLSVITPNFLCSSAAKSRTECRIHIIIIMLLWSQSLACYNQKGERELLRYGTRSIQCHVPCCSHSSLLWYRFSTFKS